jgi:hypothetical protein
MGRTACTEPQCVYKGVLYLLLYLYACPGIRSRHPTLFRLQQTKRFRLHDEGDLPHVRENALDSLLSIKRPTLCSEAELLPGMC